MADSPQSFLEVIGNALGGGMKTVGNAVQKNQEQQGHNALLAFKMLQEQHDQQLQDQERQLRIVQLRSSIANANEETAQAMKKQQAIDSAGVKIGGLPAATYAPLPTSMSEAQLPDLGPAMSAAGYGNPVTPDQKGEYNNVVANYLYPALDKLSAIQGPPDLGAIGAGIKKQIATEKATADANKRTRDMADRLDYYRQTTGSKPKTGVTPGQLDTALQSDLRQSRYQILAGVGVTNPASLNNLVAPGDESWLASLLGGKEIKPSDLVALQKYNATFDPQYISQVRSKLHLNHPDLFGDGESAQKIEPFTDEENKIGRSLADNWDTAPESLKDQLLRLKGIRK